jgi:hypothetical protein
MHRLACLPAVLACCLTLTPAAGRKPEPAWHSDLEQAKRAARASGRPIFVVFRCEH